MSRSTEQQLIINLEDSIRERLQYMIDAGELEGMDRDQVLQELNDISHEIIDSELPIYYHDMAKLLAENTRFADVDDFGILPENPTVWDIITASVYEWLSSEFHEIASEVVSELSCQLDLEG